MSKTLSRLLRQEQFAFLARDRSAWGEHLDRVRAFMGEGLQTANPARPVLILGAGSGLEIPWAWAPPATTGWDADPWSRARTALRHHRWPPWVFEDLTGGMAELEVVARRAIMEPWSGHRRDRETAGKRLAGLLPSLQPDPAYLQDWIQQHQPGAILVANVMGQFGVMAERLVERAFGLAPWNPDTEGEDPLAEAMEAWTRRMLQAFLGVLRDSGADLWLVHDRAVLFGAETVALGPWEEAWLRQVRTNGGSLEASDALAGVETSSVLLGERLERVRSERWLWPVAPGQRHLVEGVAFRRTG